MGERMNEDFAAFILTHGRPNKVITYKVLRDCGYTGKIYLIIDNEDKTADQYYANYGEQVIMFDKLAVAQRIDEGDNFNDRRSIIYARNESFEIAKKLGLRYFIELDDDYTGFWYRMDDQFRSIIAINGIKNLDKIFSYLLEFYAAIPAKSIAMAQGGDFIGGLKNKIDASITQRRKAMNTFICSPDRYFQFVSRMNEDVSTYTSYQSRGNLFMTIPFVSMQQLPTQSNSGGETEMYLKYGTYVKSFYTVMYQPSSVKIAMMNSRHPRIHHQIRWVNTVPYIIPEYFRKPDQLAIQDVTT